MPSMTLEIMRKILNPNREIYPEVINSDYIFNGVAVPRVTAILSDMLHEDGLMGWSNYIGLVKRQKYKDVLDEAANKGTYVHNAIEEYLQNGGQLNSNEVPDAYRDQVYTAWTSFLCWWDLISRFNKVEILMQEQPLVCEYYGGTLDLLLKINEKVVLVDFKTSNHLSYKYLIQLSAYKHMLKQIHNIDVDAVLVLRLDKNVCDFEEIMLRMDDEEDAELLSHCLTCFHSLVIGYYERKYIENQFKERMKTICGDRENT